VAGAGSPDELFVFLLLYIAMVAGAAYLFYSSSFYPVGKDEIGSLIWKAMAILGTG
jgi:hypothetical protein